MAKILMVISGADSLRLTDGTDHPTGFWAEEVAASHKVLRDAGHTVDFATPGGVRPTVDPVSLDARGGVSEADAREFGDYLAGIDGELAAPLDLAKVSADDYDALYIPGGHAPMTDLADSRELGALLNAADRRGTVVAALCHGVVGLLSATRPDGTFTFAGRTITAFSDAEERQGGTGDKTPYFIETRLRERGALLTEGPPWASKVVVDGNLITGQNPQSSLDTARQVLSALDGR